VAAQGDQRPPVLALAGVTSAITPNAG
jgi:hypothetical protein